MYSSSTWVGELHYANDKLFGSYKIRKIEEKGVKLLIQRNFHKETYAKHIYSCGTQVGGLYGTKENSLKCEKKVWNFLKKVWNRWYRGLFTRKPMQTIHILKVLK